MTGLQKKRWGILALALCLCGWLVGALVAAPSASWLEDESAEQKDQRMAWWRDAKFGMFIHWGLYAVPAGKYAGKACRLGNGGEWIQYLLNIPADEYAKIAETFQPDGYDPQAWVSLARDAGMKYMVFTSKHHDGFAMYESKVSAFNIAQATPYRHDTLKMLAEACAAQKMPLGLYYSQDQDWHHPGGGAYSNKKNTPAHNTYVSHLVVPQLEEILSRYGKIAAIWFDTPISMSRQEAMEILPVIRRLQPSTVMNQRLGGGVPGDTMNAEQYVPARGYPGKDWETCMTMNDTWGYRSDDTNWKSREDLLFKLVEVVGKGGNFLLNVGPDAQGRIPPESVDRLQFMGSWMKRYGDAVYGTRQGPFLSLPWGYASRRGQELFLYVTRWPASGVLPLPLSNTSVQANFFGGSAVPATRGRDGWDLQVGRRPVDANVSVIRISLTEEPRAFSIPVREAEGVLHLTAQEAQMPAGLRLEEGLAEGAMGTRTKEFALKDWKNPKDAVVWQLDLERPGRFLVKAVYSFRRENNGLRFTLAGGKSGLNWTPESAAATETFTNADLGELDLNEAGPQRVSLSWSSENNQPLKDGAIKLRQILLQRLEPRK